MARRYFLSSYLSLPDDIDAFATRHDQAIALWCVEESTVRLVRVWELERISGHKHHSWPLFTAERSCGLVAALLAEEGLGWDDIETTWGTPGLPRYRAFDAPAGAGGFPTHSLGHLFSGLLMDSRVFREETVVALAIDGAPDFPLDRSSKDFWYAGAVSQRGRITFAPVESPGMIYNAARFEFGLEEGTLMALATACDATIRFDIAAGIESLTLFGGRELPMGPASGLVRSVVDSARSQLGTSAPDPRFSAAENLCSAAMKVLQECCQRIVERNIVRLCAVAGIEPRGAYLSLSGGFALNCPTNSALADRFGFAGLLVPPCPNDSGQAYGLGLLGLFTEGHLEGRDFALGTAYHGGLPGDVDAAIAEFAPWIESVTPYSDGTFVADVTRGPLAWVSGAAEIGPRALGHRSILADPRSPAAKDELNRCKRRQWWRPVAPIVLAEHTADWFKTDRPSPYMLETAPVRPDVAPRVPAIAHLDGTARLQTLTAGDDPVLYSAIVAFHRATGVPMLCNTSLNDKGEPIVDTAADALTFCIRRGVPVAYVDGRRIALRPTGTVAAEPPTGPRPRRHRAAFEGQEDSRDRIWNTWIDAGYTAEAIYLLTRNPTVRNEERRRPEPRRANRLAAIAGERYAGFQGGVERFVAGYAPPAPWQPTEPGNAVAAEHPA
jgi:predicted NodU family carbamoyl transferase